MYNRMSIVQDPFSPGHYDGNVQRRFKILPSSRKVANISFFILLPHDMNVNTAAVSISNQICPFIVKL